ncbi:MAG: FTR1 family protein [Deltaproteobacteria bacterium]
MNIGRLLNAAASVALILCLASASFASEREAKRILSIVDYVGGDYKNAIADGNIISDIEYEEMLGFSADSLKLLELMKSAGGDRASIEALVLDLKRRIDSKAAPAEVESISKSIKEKLIATYSIATYPKNQPAPAEGMRLYEQNCAMCHGVSGGGDGLLAGGMNPQPADFTDRSFASGLSPFKVFNTANYGIEGTAMPAFPQLSDEDKWNIGFYVASLKFTAEERIAGRQLADKSEIPAAMRDYKTLSASSDDEIADTLKQSSVSDEDMPGALAYLRTGALSAPPPAGGSTGGGGDPLLAAKNFSKQSVELYKNGNREDAYTNALDAYLEGFEQVESELRVKDSDLVLTLEGQFANLRGFIKTGRPVSEVEALGAEIGANLERATIKLQDAKPLSKVFSFLNSLAIILREGLEAALIVAAVIAYLSVTGAREAVKYIHIGWISALAAGFVTWVLAQTVISISGAQREIIEGATSLIASAALFWVSYWLITKIEVKRWKDYIQGKVKEALTKKSVFALASVSFFAVYREAFETVLFYQALWIQAENSRDAVVWGIVAGGGILLVLVVVIFKLGLRVPLKYFFSVTSSFLYFLSFVLLGKGIREFQEAGVIGISPVDGFPQIDLLGIYPTVETLLAQGILLAACLFAVFWLGYVKREREKKEIAVSVAGISNDMKSMREAFDHIKSHIIEWKKCPDIDLEAEEVDTRIQDVIKRVDDLEGKLDDFFDTIVKNRETSPKPQ